MPRKTDGDKIDELMQRTATLRERINTHAKALKGLSETEQKTAETLQQIQKELALLVQFCESFKEWKAEVKKEKEEASRRKAAFGPNVTAAIISVIATIVLFIINYFLTKPK